METNPKLLDRTSFRNSVFKRDGNKCVVCQEASKLDAHHIIERRLWDDGGYYLDNGCTLCEQCHIKAETTEYSCEYLRELCKINNTILPENLYKDHIYTKWGDIILSNGTRMPGPLFQDESVQKILKLGPYYNSYIKYIKYPRTYHLPWSEGKTQDDRTLLNCEMFEGSDVVVTTKLDGENTTIYKDYIHARSIDGRDHWSRSWVKNLQSKLSWEIPEGWRICGENLYAKHSIKYTNLKSYFYVFSIWDEKNTCLSWDDTVNLCKILNLEHVPVMYRGEYDEKTIKSLYNENMRLTVEGYVVRKSNSFSYKDFNKNLAKFVRKEHVNTSHHWFFSCQEKNELYT